MKRLVAILFLTCWAAWGQGEQDITLLKPVGNGPWQAQWPSVTKRSYFLVGSTNLLDWEYFNYVQLGDGVNPLSVQLDTQLFTNVPNLNISDLHLSERFFTRIRFSDALVNQASPNANLADFDKDGIKNRDEVAGFRPPNRPLSDPLRYTDPFLWDTDGDGLEDLWEAQQGLNPRDDGLIIAANGAGGDPDGDSLINIEEYWNFTPANVANGNLDNDGVDDGVDADASHPAITWRRMPFRQYRVQELGPWDSSLGQPLDVNDRGDVLFQRCVWRAHGGSQPLATPGSAIYRWWTYDAGDQRFESEVLAIPTPTFTSNYPDQKHWEPISINNAGAVVGNALYTKNVGSSQTFHRGVYWLTPSKAIVTNPRYLDASHDTATGGASSTMFYDITHDYRIIGADIHEVSDPDLGLPDPHKKLVRWSLGSRPVGLANFSDIGFDGAPANVYAYGLSAAGLIAGDHNGMILLNSPDFSLGEVTKAYDTRKRTFFATGSNNLDVAMIDQGKTVLNDSPVVVVGITNGLVRKSGANHNILYLAGSKVNPSGQVLFQEYLWTNGVFKSLTDWVQPVVEPGQSPLYTSVFGHAISDAGTIVAKATKGGSDLLVLLYPEPARQVYEVSADDATGPRYRKVALTGLPLSDEKPQNSEETDSHKEETYVDAFNRQLSHHTSDIYVPIPASELTLQVTRSYQEEIWNDRHGLRPEERYDRPFGTSWSSSVCANIEIIEHKNHNNKIEPITLSVTDEEGRKQRFGTYNGTYYFPMPSGRVEAKFYLNSLTRSGTTFTYKRKFGNVLTYSTVDAPPAILIHADRGQSVANFQRYTYARLTKVADRFGNILEYVYDTGNNSLIPNKIKAGPAALRAQEITLQLTSDHAYIKRVTSVTDLRGNVTNYYYQNAAQTTTTTNGTEGYCLDKVAALGFSAAAPSVDYGYATWNETVDEHPRAAGSFTTPAAPIYPRHYHLTTLRDAKSNDYAFAYRLDRTKLGFHTEASNLDYIQNGQPLLLNKVTLPGNRHAYFAFSGETAIEGDPGFLSPPNNAEPKDTILKILDASGQRVDAYKLTWVQDAQGNHRWYEFGDHDVLDLDKLPGNRKPDDNGASSNLIISYLTMAVQTGGVGTETYRFNPAAGYALAQATDLNGNTISYEYDSPWAAPPQFRQLLRENRFAYFDDPTSETNGLGQTKHYEYESGTTTIGPNTFSYRVMKTITEISGKTEFFIDPNDPHGRRKRESIYERDLDAQGTPLETYSLKQETEFAYHATYPAFLTSKTVKKAASDPSWAQDLVTTYLPYTTADGTLHRLARVKEERVAYKTSGQPAQTDEFVTTYDYDANGNRTSVTDPRGKPTAFAYDTRNRLWKVTYPDDDGDANNNPFTEFRFDKNGNKVGEKDERGIWTLRGFDELNRMTAESRDMGNDAAFNADGTAIIEPRANEDLRADFVYNHLGSLTEVTDPQGNKTQHGYDSAQRRVSTIEGFTSNVAATTSFFYESSYAGDELGTNRHAGSSVFDVSGFKPTRIVDPRGYETLVSYDARYREIHRKSQYTLFPAKYAEVETLYDDEGRRVTRREKVTTPTTPEAVTWLVSETQSDGLGRAMQTTVAKDTADEFATKNFHTSTGLPWKTEEHGKVNGVLTLLRQTEKEYDQAGRAILTIALDPVSGLRSNDSPITRAMYDLAGNVVATTDPRGLQISNGLVSGNADMEKYTTYFAYDARNRRVGTASPLISVTTAGTSGTITALDGRAVTLTIYDAKGNPVQGIDPRGTSFTLVQGLPAQEAALKNKQPILTVSTAGNAASYTTSTIHDEADRPTTVSAPAVPIYTSPGQTTSASASTVTGYDKNGNVIQVTDMNGNVVVRGYDARNRPISTKTSPTSVPTSGTLAAHEIEVINQYDLVGNLATVIADAGVGRFNQVTEFQYDGLNRKTAVIHDPGTKQDKTRYTFNEVYLTERKDENGGAGRITTYGYDNQKRLTSTSYEGRAADDHTRIYDAQGNLKEVQYSGTDTRDVLYGYDKLSRVTSETSAGYTHTSQYDKAGNRTKLTYSGGRFVDSVYDGLNRLVSMDDSAESINTTYGYDIASNRVSLDLPNGTRTLASFDARSRQQRSTVWTPPNPTLRARAMDHRYAFDQAGNLIEQAERFNKSGTTAHDRVIWADHDNLYRLKTQRDYGVTFVDATDTYTVNTGTIKREEGFLYNNAHNLTKKTVSGSESNVIDYFYAEGTHNSNQLSREIRNSPVSTTNHDYDAYGNRIASTGGRAENVTYDHENRIVTVAYNNGTPRTYVSDDRSRRVSRNEGTATTITYSGGTSAQEYQGTVQVHYIRGSDMGGGIGGILYSDRTSGGSKYFHYNQRGDVTAKTSTTASGNLDYFASYRPFGDSVEQGANADPQGPNTKERDSFGLIHEGFRDRRDHVFYQRDPAGFVDTTNLYSYVSNNPMAQWDPLGLESHGPFWDRLWNAGVGAIVIGGHVSGANDTVAFFLDPSGFKEGYSGNTDSSASSSPSHAAGQRTRTKVEVLEVMNALSGVKLKVAPPRMPPSPGGLVPATASGPSVVPPPAITPAAPSLTASMSGGPAAPLPPLAPVAGSSPGGKTQKDIVEGQDSNAVTEAPKGKTASDSSKNERHGDGGRSLLKVEKQIQDLEEQLRSAAGREAKQIKQKIKNIQETARQKKKGVEHSRKGKG